MPKFKVTYREIQTDAEPGHTYGNTLSSKEVEAENKDAAEKKFYELYPGIGTGENRIVETTEITED